MNGDIDFDNFLFLCLNFFSDEMDEFLNYRCFFLFKASFISFYCKKCKYLQDKG